MQNCSYSWSKRKTPWQRIIQSIPCHRFCNGRLSYKKIMLKQGDRAIIEVLHLFRYLSRDQISYCVLKRLRREGEITANENYTPFIYIRNPPMIKCSSLESKTLFGNCLFLS